MTVHCFYCSRCFKNADSLPAHDCRRTTHKQTENTTTRVTPEQWAQISARLQHPSSTYVPDGAA
jgi:hypothetical protein